MTVAKSFWLLWRNSKLSTSNTILVCTAVLKPIWNYAIKFWYTASTSSIEILEGLQPNVLSHDCGHDLVRVEWSSEEISKHQVPCGTSLQAFRSRDIFGPGHFIFSNYLILPLALWAWDQLKQKLLPRIFPELKISRCVNLIVLLPSVSPLSGNCDSLDV
jgi:hypothetical protein